MACGEPAQLPVVLFSVWAQPSWAEAQATELPAPSAGLTRCALCPHSRHGRVRAASAILCPSARRPCRFWAHPCWAATRTVLRASVLVPTAVAIAGQDAGAAH